MQPTYLPHRVVLEEKYRKGGGSLSEELIEQCGTRSHVLGSHGGYQRGERLSPYLAWNIQNAGVLVSRGDANRHGVYRSG